MGPQKSSQCIVYPNTGPADSKWWFPENEWLNARRELDRGRYCCVGGVRRGIGFLGLRNVKLDGFKCLARAPRNELIACKKGSFEGLRCSRCITMQGERVYIGGST